MKKILLSLLAFGAFLSTVNAQEERILLPLVRLPLKAITTEYPNKTGQIINNEQEAHETPSQLHPVFYGSFDWHSSVHSHWMLVRTLRRTPQISLRDSIISALENSFTQEKLLAEANYFSRPLAATFERTYGWAWLLRLDMELASVAQRKSADPDLAERASRWHQYMQPLTEYIVRNWQEYLPKMTYPDRIGTHANSAFALSFAYDWAIARNNEPFAQAIRARALALFSNDRAIPAAWEPNPTDFFSPALMEANLMRQLLPQQDFIVWLGEFLTEDGVENLSKLPIVADLNDYHIVHLVGLSFSRAWCMSSIAAALPSGHPLKERWQQSAEEHYTQGMNQIFKSNFGGDHWLGSFAAYAYDQMHP